MLTESLMSDSTPVQAQDNLEMYRSMSWRDLFHHSFVKALGSFQGSQINGRICHKLFPGRWIYRKAGGGFFLVWRAELQTVQLEPLPSGFFLFNWWQSVLVSDRDNSPIQHKFPLYAVHRSQDTEETSTLSLLEPLYVRGSSHELKCPNTKKLPSELRETKRSTFLREVPFHFSFWKYYYPLIRVPKARRVIA